jgi:thiamine biosynthesis lipoprotein ApbE
MLKKNGVIKRKMIKLNFGAIAKGIRCGRACEIIRVWGRKNFLINAGVNKSDGESGKLGYRIQEIKTVIVRT